MRIRSAAVLALAVGTLAAGSHFVVVGAAPSVAPGVDRPSSESSVEQIYQEVFVSTDEDARRAREDAQTSQYQECLKSQGVWDLPEADWGDEEQNLAHQCDDSVYGQDLAVQDATLEYQIELAELMLQEEQDDEALASEVSRYETCMAAAGVSHRVLSDVGAATRQMNASDKARHKKCSPGVSKALDKAHQRAVDKFERKQKQAILRAIRSALREAR